MYIRSYQPGDEAVQVALYNEATRSLPGHKPATVDDVSRRYRAADFDPASKLYAEEGGQVVGYILYNPNGRISLPWCRADGAAARRPLLEAALSAMGQRGIPEAWAAYRADWTEPLAFLREHGFRHVRDMVNYVAELDRLPRAEVPAGWKMEPLGSSDIARLPELNRGLFAGGDPATREAFYLKSTYFSPEAGYALKDAAGQTLGVGVAIADTRFADPTKVDAAMPCFRLGALGTETERHKRINGLFSAVFESEPAGTALLCEAVRRFAEAGLKHVGAQAESDQPALSAFYERHFRRQGQFPILARET